MLPWSDGCEHPSDPIAIEMSGTGARGCARGCPNEWLTRVCLRGLSEAAHHDWCAYALTTDREPYGETSIVALAAENGLKSGG